MIGRVLLAALLAGIAAGLIAGVFQHVRMTPLILQAETFEVANAAVAAGGGHAHDTETAAHPQDQAQGWAPKDGFERTLFTLVTTALAGAGWAAMLAGVSFLLAIPITRDNGLVWGLCGFLTFSLAPAAGLPPELPGMAAAELNARILWWAVTAAMTGGALWLIVVQRAPWAVLAGIAVIVVPHIIGAPQASSHDSSLSAGLVQTFVANSLALSALMWGLIGVFLGFALQHYEKDAQA